MTFVAIFVGPICELYNLGVDNQIIYAHEWAVALRRRYTIRFARTAHADCPVHESIVKCDMSLECTGHVKIGRKGITPRSIFEPIPAHELCKYRTTSSSKRPASDGGRCSGQLLMMWAAVCSGSPHSHAALSASPHFVIDAHDKKRTYTFSNGGRTIPTRYCVWSERDAFRKIPELDVNW